MYRPEHSNLEADWCGWWMYWRDVPRETILLRVWLNPLNYEVSFVHMDRSHRRRCLVSSIDVGNGCATASGGSSRP